MTGHASTEEASPAAQSWGRSAGLLSIATVIVSGGNYAFSLVAVRLLSPAAFSMFGASQGFLLVLGTGAMAAIPWAVARYMVVEDHAGAPQEAMRFGVIASVWQALILGPVAGLVVGATTTPIVGLVTGIAGFVIALSAAPTGFLQGSGQVVRIAWLRLLEVGARLVSGLGLVLVVSRTATSALIGFPIGTALLLIAGLLSCRAGFPLRRAHRTAVRSLLRQSIALGIVQVLMSMLAALDTVVAPASGFDPTTSASYQAAALLGRVPLFLSGAIALASYTAMAGARDEAEAGRHLRNAVLVYLATSLPIVIACCTVPINVLHLVIPQTYTAAPTMLRFTAVSGALIGLINVVTTAHQARSVFRSVIRILVPVALMQPVFLLVAGRTLGSTAFLWTLVAVSGIGTVLVCWDARQWHLGKKPQGAVIWLILVLALGGMFLIGNPVAWVLYCGILTGLMAVRAARVFTDKAAPVPDEDLPSGKHRSPADEPLAGQFAQVTAVASVPPLRRRIVLGENPEGPRVIVVGDSLIFGLGYSRTKAFGRLVANDLKFSALLNLSASAQTSAEALALYSDLIAEFKPTVGIACLGGAEGMVHPRPSVQRMIERFLPADWHGVAGLQPRALFADQRMERIRQKAQSVLKVIVKWVLIRGLGGGPRVPLPEAVESAARLLSLIESCGAAICLVGLPHTPNILFPGTDTSFRATNAGLEAAVRSMPNVSYLPVADRLDYYGDFLGDRVHLGAEGHRHVAEMVLAHLRDHDFPLAIPPLPSLNAETSSSEEVPPRVAGRT